MRPPHYIRPNEANRLPRRWVWLDTEAVEHVDGPTRTQSWRCGVTCFDRSDTDNHTERPPEWKEWSDPDEMWWYIDSKTRRKCRTVVVAHNVGYDVRISHALTMLPKMEWNMDQLAVAGKSIMMTWRRDNRSLVVVDSMSYLPMGLERVATLMGTAKLALPAWTDAPEAWFARCRRDVEIMRDAYRSVLGWIEDTDLGNWQKTGAGMAWANWRHRHYTHRVLVHSTEDATNAEAAAVGTGRCEAWRHGTLKSETWTEWDLPLAYPRITDDTRVPTALLAHRWKPSPQWLAKTTDTTMALVRATVTVNQPVLGVKTDEGWRWPVGTFTGWWWNHELALATGVGDNVIPHECYVYRAYYSLRQWARWVMAVVEDRTGNYTPLQQAVAKHWARALIGRFGARYPVWTEFGQSPEEGVSLNACYDADNGREGKALTIGDKFYLGLDSTYVADACPAVMGSVMAWARVRLWTLIQNVGTQNVAYMDTDSLIVNKVGNEVLTTWTEHGGGWGLRPKQRWRTLEIMGPRQLIVDGRGRIAGVPSKAKRIERHKWSGEVWDTMQGSMAKGTANTVVIHDRPWQVDGIDRRRIHNPDGTTSPHRLIEGTPGPNGARAS